MEGQVPAAGAGGAEGKNAGEAPRAPCLEAPRGRGVEKCARTRADDPQGAGEMETEAGDDGEGRAGHGRGDGSCA